MTSITITIHIDTGGPQIAAAAETVGQLTRIPQTVHRAIMAALAVADDYPEMSTGEIVDDLARAAVKAWEATKPAPVAKPVRKAKPVVAPEPEPEPARPESARVAGGFHTAEMHGKATT